MNEQLSRLTPLTPEMRKILRLAQWEAERDRLHCGLRHFIRAMIILYGDDLPSQIQVAADELKKQQAPYACLPTLKTSTSLPFQEKHE